MKTEKLFFSLSYISYFPCILIIQVVRSICRQERIPTRFYLFKNLTRSFVGICLKYNFVILFFSTKSQTCEMYGYYSLVENLDYIFSKSLHWLICEFLIQDLFDFLAFIYVFCLHILSIHLRICKLQTSGAEGWTDGQADVKAFKTSDYKIQPWNGHSRFVVLIA